MGTETGAAAAEIVGDVAKVIGVLSDAFRDQAEFHVGGGTAFGVQNLREARVMADRRSVSAGFAGPRLLREIAKTLLLEATRGTLLAQRALADAGTEAWPSLEDAVDDARRLLARVAETEPSLLHPTGTELPASGRSLPAADFADPPGWCALGDGGFARLDARVPLSVASMPAPGGGTVWTSRFGGAAVAMHGSPASAAAASEAALDAVFGAGSGVPRPR